MGSCCWRPRRRHRRDLSASSTGASPSEARGGRRPLGVYADADLVLAAEPGLVVVATGGVPTDRAGPGAPSWCSTPGTCSAGRRPACTGGGCWSSTSTAPSPRSTPPSTSRRLGARVELVTPERTIGISVGVDVPPGLSAGLRRARVTPDRGPAAALGPARRTRGGRPAGGRSGQRVRPTPRSRSGSSTRSSSSTAPCPTTSSTSSSCPARATSARSTTPPCSAAGPRRWRPIPTAAPALPHR